MWAGQAVVGQGSSLAEQAPLLWLKWRFRVWHEGPEVTKAVGCRIGLALVTHRSVATGDQVTPITPPLPQALTHPPFCHLGLWESLTLA